MMNPKKLLDDIEGCHHDHSGHEGDDDRSAASTTSSVSGSSNGRDIHHHLLRSSNNNNNSRHHHSPYDNDHYQGHPSPQCSPSVANGSSFQTPTTSRTGGSRKSRSRTGAASSSMMMMMDDVDDDDYDRHGLLASPALCHQGHHGVHTPATVYSSSSESSSYSHASSSPLSTFSQRTAATNRSNHSTNSSTYGSHSHHQNNRSTKVLFFVLGVYAAGVIIQTLNRMDGLRSQLKTGGMAALDSTTTSSSSSIGTGRSLPVNNEQEDGQQHPLGTLYVPSLDFRMKGVSQYSVDGNFEAHVYCKDGFAKDLKWEWWKADASTRDLQDVAGDSFGWGSLRQQEGSNVQLSPPSSSSSSSSYSSSTITSASSSKNTMSRRLMIGVYAGHDDYSRLLEKSVWSARVYAQKWGHRVTVVTLQGTAFAPHGCKAPPSHSTLNKIRLLFHALDHKGDYDQVLLLDADTFVFDLDTDITSLLDEEYVVAGQHVRVNNNNSINGKEQQLADHRPRNDPWMIHPGATLWNLHHPLTTDIAIEWFESAKSAVVRGEFVGDGPHMQSTLRTFVKRERTDDSDSPLVLNFQHNEFDYSHGKVVKQFVREDFDRLGGGGLSDSSLASTKNVTVEELNTERLQKMDEAAQRVCARFSTECASVPVPQYAT